MLERAPALRRPVCCAVLLFLPRSSVRLAVGFHRVLPSVNVVVVAVAAAAVVVTKCESGVCFISLCDAFERTK